MIQYVAKKLAPGRYWLVLFGLIASILVVAIPQKAAAAGEVYTWQSTTSNGVTVNQIVATSGEFDKFNPQLVTFDQENNTNVYRNNRIASRIQNCGSANQPRYIITYDASTLTGTITTEFRGTCTDAPTVTGTFTIGGTAPAGSSGGTQPVTADDDWCESGTDPSELKYFMCPVIEVAAGFIEKIDCQILALVKIDTVSIFDTGGVPKSPVCGSQDSINEPDENSAKSSAAYHAIWRAFRTIALTILVILGLIMVASQVMNLDIFDAYTVKKMLPKLIIATIFMSLSWEIMEFLYNAANASADAVMAIIKLPFKSFTDVAPGQSTAEFLFTLPVTSLIFGGVAGAGLAGLGIFLGLLGIGGVLALIASLAIAMFSVAVLLIARDIIATMLVVFAPIAIICWAYQPFERVFTFWRTFLIGLLLSIPAVALILGITQAAALVALLNE